MADQIQAGSKVTWSPAGDPKHGTSRGTVTEVHGDIARIAEDIPPGRDQGTHVWANTKDIAPAWAPDETGDAIDFLASIDSHNLGHDDEWETGL